MSKNKQGQGKALKKQINTIIGNKIRIKCKNKHQKRFLNLIDDKEITLCTGPAGTGKSFLAMTKALQLLQEKNEYYKLIILRPIIEAAESRIGILPGDVEEKLAPYVYPGFYLIDKLVGKDVRKQLREVNVIQITALGFMRGVNVDNSILVFDEAQNASIEQMKLLLTRIGFNSKFIINGDIEQSDRFKRGSDTGLFDARERFSDLDNFGIFKFEDKHIVRNPLVKQILDRYNEK